MVEGFHGHMAPGVLLGGIMVDLAYRHLPEEGLFDSVCETSTCLPDAIQILTPCSVGNGWLKIVDSGRFALTLYDKNKGDGVRVFLASHLIEPASQLFNWFFRVVPKSEQDYDLLIKEIIQAGSDILGFQKVHVDVKLSEKVHRPRNEICPRCKEAYPQDHGPLCRHCSGERRYYTELP